MSPEGRSFDSGKGDYTKERHNWLPENLDDVMTDLLVQQKNRNMKKLV
jgi:hypothetical protein